MLEDWKDGRLEVRNIKFVQQSVCTLNPKTENGFNHRLRSADSIGYDSDTLEFARKRFYGHLQ